MIGGQILVVASEQVGNSWAKVALQVNSFAYLQNHKKQLLAESWAADEQTFNDAMVASALENGVSVVAITDHYTARDSEGLRAAFEGSGIAVLPGFEASSEEGVHVLCIFDRSATADHLENLITELVGPGVPSRRHADSRFSFANLCEKVAEHGGLPIPAHALESKGLLRVLSGRPLETAMGNSALCAIATDRKTRTQRDEELLSNAKELRPTPLAAIEASDVWEPRYFGEPSATCWLKLSQECLSEPAEDLLASVRLALTDSAARVAQDINHQSPRVWIRSVSWTSTPLFGTERLDLNSGQNVFIGGRGAGKSALLSSISWTLGVDSELTAGTEHAISVEDLVGQGEIGVELVVDGVPHVVTRRRDSPPEHDLSALPALSGFAQGEIDRNYGAQAFRVRLIERFCEGLPELRRGISEALAAVTRVQDSLTEIDLAIADLNHVPDQLQATNERLEDASEKGLQPATQEVASFSRTQRFFDQSADLAGSLVEAVSATQSTVLKASLPESPAVDGDPDPSGSRRVRESFEQATTEINAALDDALKRARELSTSVQQIRTDRSDLQAAAERRRQEIFAQLGEDELGLPQLEKVRSELEEQNALLDDLKARRLAAVTELAEKTAELGARRAELSKAVREGCSALHSRIGMSVIVRVVENSEPSELISFLESEDVSEKSIEAIVEQLRSTSEGPNSTSELVEHIRRREDWFHGDTRRIAGFRRFEEDEPFLRRLESRALNDFIELELLVDGKPQSLNRLSVGQRVTAALMILLAEGPAPLIIDQPEDDLDNRFIAGELVQAFLAGRDRQVLLATHNANIAVLGGTDFLAELRFEAGGCGFGAWGSIDARDVSIAVQDTLEGGREALERRSRLYRSTTASLD